MLNAKILAYKKSQRYAVRRTLLAACDELRKSQPDIAITITEVKELAEIEKYTLVVILSILKLSVFPYIQTYLTLLNYSYFQTLLLLMLCIILSFQHQ